MLNILFQILYYKYCISNRFFKRDFIQHFINSYSPGFLKDDFMKYFTEKAVRVGDVQFIKQKSKFLKAHTSSGHKRSIDELLGK